MDIVKNKNNKAPQIGSQLYCKYFIKFLAGGQTAQPVLRGIAKDPSKNIPLIYTLTNPEPYLLYLAYTPQEAIFLCLNHLRVRYPTTRDHFYSPKAKEIIQSR